jgi:hypothetical protein
MTLSSNDDDLRARFRELEEQVSASVPAFSVGPSRRVERPVARWVLASGALASVAVAVLLVTLWPRHEAGPAFGLDLSTVVWVSPTDYLLDTPGSRLLHSIPSLDLAGYAPVLVDPDRSAVDTSS